MLLIAAPVFQFCNKLLFLHRGMTVFKSGNHPSAVLVKTEIAYLTCNYNICNVYTAKSIWWGSTEDSHITINTESVVFSKLIILLSNLIFQGWTVQLFWVQMTLSAEVSTYVAVITLTYIIGGIMKLRGEFSEGCLLQTSEGKGRGKS